MTQLILHNLSSFILIISLLVFIHEFGHFFIARLCGVAIDEFSIGFGREIFGFTDKKGTRWKFCALPLGGYVKMYGDKNGASMPDEKAIAKMSKSEKQKSFIFKNVYQRFAIVLAGPAINFLFAILIFSVLFKINGLSTVLPIIDEISPKSAAFEAGLKKGDEIIAINDQEIEDFNKMRQIVEQNPEKPLIFHIKRGYKVITQEISPKYHESTNIFGEKQRTGLLGVTSKEVSHVNLTVFESFCQANLETYNMSRAILGALGDLLTGKRDFKELGGPIKIAQYSGKTVSMGLTMTLWFMAVISINLGVMNLLPVPVLDGGHLFYYLFEMMRGKPLPEKIQQIGFRLGFSLVLTLMIFTTYNDISQLIFGK